MTVFRLLGAVLCLAALPLAADPLAYVILGGSPSTLQRFSNDWHSVTTIASVPGGIALTKSAVGEYVVAAGSSLQLVDIKGEVFDVADAPSGSPAPQWVAVAHDGDGNFITVDDHQHAIWRIKPSSPVTVTLVAHYTVSNAASSESAGIVVDEAGNYLVLEDNGSALHMFSITPAGVVTPIPLSGATATTCTDLIADNTGAYLFSSSAQNAVFRVTAAGVVSQVAGSVASGGILEGVAENPNTGELFVIQNGSNPVMRISADGSFIGPIANATQARGIIAETYGQLPQLAAGDVWTTGFYILNTGNRTVWYQIGFYSQTGGNLSLPLPGGHYSGLFGSLAPHGSHYVEAADPAGQLKVGSGVISADASVTVQALFRDHAIDGKYYEAGVQASAGAKEFVIPFDATTFAATGDGLFTGFAISNMNPLNSATVTCVATDIGGNVIPNAVIVPTLNPLGQYAAFSFPALTGKRGSIDCSANSKLAAIALRFIGATAFSSLPVLYK